MSSRPLTDAERLAAIAEIVGAGVKAEPSSALRIGVQVGILLARDPLLGANEVDARIRGRRETIQEAVRLGKAFLLGARTGRASGQDDRIPSPKPGPGSVRFPDAATATLADGADRADAEEAA